MYEDYDLELNNVNIKIPWHIQKPKKAHVKNINIKTLYANIINKKNCIIEDTHHMSINNEYNSDYNNIDIYIDNNLYDTNNIIS